MACAWRERGNGQDCSRSSKVLSSMATTSSPGAGHRAAALEALVDRVLLEAGQQARELHRAAGADGDQGGHHGRDDGAPGDGLGGRARPSVSPPGARGGCCPARTTTVRPVRRSRTRRCRS